MYILFYIFWMKTWPSVFLGFLEIQHLVLTMLNIIYSLFSLAMPKFPSQVRFWWIKDCSSQTWIMLSKASFTLSVSESHNSCGCSLWPIYYSFLSEHILLLNDENESRFVAWRHENKSDRTESVLFSFIYKKGTLLVWVFCIL